MFVCLGRKGSTFGSNYVPTSDKAPHYIDMDGTKGKKESKLRGGRR